MTRKNTQGDIHVSFHSWQILSDEHPPLHHFCHLKLCPKASLVRNVPYSVNGFGKSDTEDFTVVALKSYWHHSKHRDATSKALLKTYCHAPASLRKHVSEMITFPRVTNNQTTISQSTLTSNELPCTGAGERSTQLPTPLSRFPCGTVYSSCPRLLELV